VDDRKRAEQVRVTPMNGSGRKRRTPCADGEVCPSLARKEEKTFLTRPTSLEIAR
jgi:hypothetical protein